MKYLIKAAASVALVAYLTGCAAFPSKNAKVDYPVLTGQSQKMLSGVHLDDFMKNATAKDYKVVVEGIKALKEGKLKEASDIFNVALKLNITSGEIHTLNALAYHLLALSGDKVKFEMAEEGYRVALRMDPSNWLAKYQLGLCYLDQRKYRQAELNLVQAALIGRDNPQLLLDLATAAYYAGHPRVAQGALLHLAQVAPELAKTPDYLRAVVMTKAARNDAEGVKDALAEYRALPASPDVTKLVNRTLDWSAYYKIAQSKSALLKTAYQPSDSSGFEQSPETAQMPDGAPTGESSGFEENPEPAKTPDSIPDDQKMVVVDVVLISTQEDVTETYGVNLLKGLSLQYGDANGPAWSSAGTKTTNIDPTQVDPAYTTSTQTITRSMSIPSVSYSLNIANAVNSNDEIIAKPSIVALSGQMSEFFSGSEISAAAVSGGAGDSVSIEKEIGVKLSVTPNFLPDGKVRLQIAAQRTFLTTPSNSVVFQYRLDTSKTTLNSNVVMKLGDTLVLGGLMESEDAKSVDGVPYVRAIPVLNFLFSTHGKMKFRKSVLIMLTPRTPIYGGRSQEDRKADLAGMSEYEKSVSQLELRNSDWFMPRPVIAEAREKLSLGELTREIQLGDVKFERWNKRVANGYVVNQVLERLAI